MVIVTIDDTNTVNACVYLNTHTHTHKHTLQNISNSDIILYVY